KQTRPSDAAPKVVVTGRVAPPVKKPTEPSSTAPSWMKKKDTLPLSPSKEKEPVEGKANGTDTPQSTVSPSEPAPIEAPIVAEPEPVTTGDLSDSKDDIPPATKVAHSEEPAVETATTEPKEEPSNAPAPSTATPSKSNPPSRITRPGTGGSKAPAAVSSGPSQGVAKPSKTVATNAKAPSSTNSPLNKAKSTPALKKGPDSASNTPSKPSATKAKDATTPAQPLRPQHTGASTASNPRRIVSTTGGASTSGTKTPATTGGPPLVKPQPTRPTKVSQSSTLYAPTAATLARQRKEEAGPPPSAGKKAAALTSSPTTRPRAGSTSGTTTSGLRPLQLPLKSSVSASGSTRRMVSVPRVPKPGATEGEAAAQASTEAGSATRSGSPAKRTPSRPFPSRSPTKSPLSKAQMGGNARISKHAAVGAWAGAVAAAVTSEEELILSGEKSAPEGSGMEETKAVTPEAQQEDVFSAKPADLAASSGSGEVIPDPSGSVDTTENQAPAEPAATQEPEEEQEEAKTGPHTDLEDTAAAPSTEDEPTTPEPQAAVPIVGATSATPEEDSEHRQQPEQDELEQMVNMLEAPRKALHFGASSDEDDEPSPAQQAKTAPSIPDIPDDG
ncbi:hypothetical protein FRB90_009567, partial [Tulasnella sp. 427]